MSSTRSRRPWIRSLLGGFLISAVGTLVAPFGWVVVPGMVLAWVLFPEGVHTGSGGTEYFLVIFLASAVAWSAVLFVVSTLWHSLRRQRSDESPA